MKRKDVLSLTEGKPYDIRASSKSYNTGFFDSAKMDDYMSTNAFIVVVNGKAYPGVFEGYDFDKERRPSYMWHIKAQREDYYKAMRAAKYKRNRNYREDTIINEEKFENFVLPKLQELGKIEVDCPYYMIYVKGIEIPTVGGWDWGLERMHLQVCGITYYPILKELNFANIIDPYTMYQEIDMWFGTHANPDNCQVPVGDDETLAEAKGFDRKFSFRKEPGKKKRGKNK
jgi:hypothetical protein